MNEAAAAATTVQVEISARRMLSVNQRVAIPVNLALIMLGVYIQGGSVPLRLYFVNCYIIPLAGWLLL